MNLVLGAHSQFGLNYTMQDGETEEDAETNKDEDEKVSDEEAKDLFDGLLSPLKQFTLTRGTIRGTMVNTRSSNQKML